MEERKQWYTLYVRNKSLYTRFLKFSLVGFSGVLVNTGLLYVLTAYLGVVYFISSIFAIELSILSNFLLNDIWTWRDRTKKTFWKRLLQYHISVGITAVLVNWVILILLTEFFGLYYMISNLIGIACGTLANYLINDLWTFKNS
jgi:dolichol-phosphate mannosyltransferase